MRLDTLRLAGFLGWKEEKGNLEDSGTSQSWSCLIVLVWLVIGVVFNKTRSQVA